MPEDLNNQEIIDDQDIHVMPSLESEEMAVSNPKAGINYKLWIGIMVALLLAVGIGGGVYYLFFANKSTEPVNNNNNQAPQEIVNIDPILDSTSTPTSTEETASSSYNLLDIDGRDQQRLTDIQTIRMALEQYYKTQSQFPYELGALLDGYVTALPKEPTADGKTKSYSYIVDANRLDFKIIFTIEGEPTYFSVRLTPGRYYASRQSILPYQDNGTGTLPGGNGTPSPAQFSFSLNPPQLGLDSDADGLTDIEENVWGTNSDKVDTDGDTFKDKDELFTFYDPAAAKKRLLDSETAAVYKNAQYNYSVIYPSAFAVRALSAENDQIIFSDANGAYFNVIVMDNPSNLSTYIWYNSNNPTISTTNFRSFLVDNFPALQTPDGLITYVAVGSKVFVISYNLGTINEANYISTYRLFLKSFMFGEVTESTVITPTSTPVE